MAIHVNTIRDAVAKLCIDANYFLNEDIHSCFVKSLETETNELARTITGILIENAEIAKATEVPICQDTGMAVVFVELGQEVCIEGGLLVDAIHSGVAKGYEEGYLRKSVVRDPIDSVNTKDNTPAIIHLELVAGNALHLTVAPKGFGSENMSALKMLKPADGIEGVTEFVVDTVKRAGGNPCPPIVVGVGVGGTMEKACLLAKQALLREIGSTHATPFWAEMEAALLKDINALDIGPSGLGGQLTAMAVHVNAFPTHIAGLPVAVNIGCHATRHAETVLYDDEKGAL